MIEIFWDKKFKRIYKKWISQHPDLLQLFQDRIALFEKDPFHPSLRTHTLSGPLKDLWSYWINYDQRLVFRFIDRARQKVLLVDIGTHDEVY